MNTLKMSNKHWISFKTFVFLRDLINSLVFYSSLKDVLCIAQENDTTFMESPKTLILRLKLTIKRNNTTNNIMKKSHNPKSNLKNLIGNLDSVYSNCKLIYQQRNN